MRRMIAFRTLSARRVLQKQICGLGTQMTICRIASIAFASLLSGVATGHVTSTVVDLPSRGALQRILYVTPDAPIANIVSIPGGNGTYNIQNDGTLTGQGPCGPWGRNAQAFAGRGLAIALVDQTSAGSVYNVNDILEVVRYVQSRNNVPTWIVGGSAATETECCKYRSMPNDPTRSA